MMLVAVKCECGKDYDERVHQFCPSCGRETPVMPLQDGPKPKGSGLGVVVGGGTVDQSRRNDSLVIVIALLAIAAVAAFAIYAMRPQTPVVPPDADASAIPVNPTGTPEPSQNSMREPASLQSGSTAGGNLEASRSGGTQKAKETCRQPSSGVKDAGSAPTRTKGTPSSAGGASATAGNSESLERDLPATGAPSSSGPIGPTETLSTSGEATSPDG